MEQIDVVLVIAAIAWLAGLVIFLTSFIWSLPFVFKVQKIFIEFLISIRDPHDKKARERSSNEEVRRLYKKGIKVIKIGMIGFLITFIATIAIAVISRF